MAKESTQKKLERVRPPRVQISYDVETGGAIEMKELPFVMGVLGDFTGQPVEPLAKLKERKFVDITLDNFDEVLASMKPHLAFSVENKLSDDPDAGKLAVDLKFESLDDFSPDAVARQIKPLKERKFVDITLDNFDEVLSSMKPHLALSVENKLSDDPNAGKLAVDLKFESLDDFSPDAVARQIGPLKELLELRTKLADLRGALGTNEKLDSVLAETLGDEEKMKKLKAELESQGGGNG